MAEAAEAEQEHEQKEEETDPSGPEDPPLVSELKRLDDQYLELEREYQREARKLLHKYSQRQQPYLEERRRLLACSPNESTAAASKTGTPALKRFWLEAMQNHPAFEECIQEWDEAVLEYLADIQRGSLGNPEDDEKGFKLTFQFTENPYFTNSELTKEYRLEVVNPYCGEVEVKEIKSSPIHWKNGKDITIERVSKKAKGGGSKKNKQRKEKDEPRPSFFRDFFRTLRPDMELTEDAREQARSYAEEDEDEDDSDETLVAYLIDSDHDIAVALRDNIIPYAVRWYTGEASPEDDDDTEEDEEEEDEAEDDEEDEEDEDEEAGAPPPKGHKGKAGGGSGKSKTSASNKIAETHNEKECKQQ